MNLCIMFIILCYYTQTAIAPSDRFYYEQHVTWCETYGFFWTIWKSVQFPRGFNTSHAPSTRYDEPL